MAQKKIPKPAWYKNTYFWIAAVLFILCIVGLVGGDIRDPGQKREGFLWLLYLVASGVMLLNGLMSHAQTVQHYNEAVGAQDGDSTKGTTPKSIEGTPDAMPNMQSGGETIQE